MITRVRLLAIAVVATVWFAMSGHAQNSLRWTTNHYAVTGATLGEIQHSLRASRPWKSKSSHDGLTDWRINWRFNLASSGGACRCNSFTTTTTISITLPRWNAPTNTSDHVKTEWARYIAALGQHEAGHAQFALAAAGEMHKQIKSLGEAPDCETLKSRLNGLCEATLGDYRRREKEYDERTRHGATQGAVLRSRMREDRERSRE